MILYHGSPKTGLKELRFSEEMSRFGGEMGLKHGLGTYLTTSLDEAIAYAVGGSYYLVKVKGQVFDTTDREEMMGFISEIESEFKCEGLLSQNSLILEVINQTMIGRISGINFARAILNAINDQESLYNDFTLKYFEGDLDKVDSYFSSRFNYQAIKLNNLGSATWVIILDPEGANLEIIEEISCE